MGVVLPRRKPTAAFQLPSGKRTLFCFGLRIKLSIVGAFTEYLLLTYGTERYRLFWQKENGGEEGFRKAYGKTTGELSREFEQYLTLFSLDGGVRERIAAKLSGAPASPG